MKNAKKKNILVVDYTASNFQPCWTCTKACGGCSWSKDFKPVPGWIAEKRYIPSNGELAETYKIISCPEYIKEKGR